jgi:uncharacterized damage-inducible protein DinB
MTDYGGKELAASFCTVRTNTIQIAEEIPEGKYDSRAAVECRSIGRTLAHIAIASGIQIHLHSNKVADLKNVNFPELMEKLAAEEAQPRTKAEIITLLKTEGERFASFVGGLADSFLAERVTMRSSTQPATKSRFEMLLSPKEHEMHHRGQLMMMERMLGLVPHLTRQFQARMALAQQAQQ